MVSGYLGQLYRPKPFPSHRVVGFTAPLVKTEHLPRISFTTRGGRALSGSASAERFQEYSGAGRGGLGLRDARRHNLGAYEEGVPFVCKKCLETLDRWSTVWTFCDLRKPSLFQPKNASKLPIPSHTFQKSEYLICLLGRYPGVVLSF